MKITQELQKAIQESLVEKESKRIEEAMSGEIAIAVSELLASKKFRADLRKRVHLSMEEYLTDNILDFIAEEKLDSMVKKAVRSMIR